MSDQQEDVDQSSNPLFGGRGKTTKSASEITVETVLIDESLLPSFAAPSAGGARSMSGDAHDDDDGMDEDDQELVYHESERTAEERKLAMYNHTMKRKKKQEGEDDDDEDGGAGVGGMQRNKTVQTMRAMQVERFRSFTYTQTDRPRLWRRKFILVKVKAASVNPTDWKLRDGQIPFMLRPYTAGCDFSGVVEDVGDLVEGFEEGDEVMGFAEPLHREGSYAEYIAVDPGCCCKKPKNVSHVEAASIVFVGLAAQQALVGAASIKKGDRVLIHGAGGGVGSFAVQLAAKVFGAHVIATCSREKAEFVTQLGASEVYDYTVGQPVTVDVQPIEGDGESAELPEPSSASATSTISSSSSPSSPPSSPSSSSSSPADSLSPDADVTLNSIFSDETPTGSTIPTTTTTSSSSPSDRNDSHNDALITPGAWAEKVRDCDIVLNCVSATVEDQSWPTLKPTGTLVSLVLDTGGGGAVALVKSFAKLFYNYSTQYLRGPFYSRPRIRAAPGDLDIVRGYIESEQVHACVTRVFPLSELGQAADIVKEGHTQGKIVIDLTLPDVDPVMPAQTDTTTDTAAEEKGEDEEREAADPSESEGDSLLA